MHFSQSFAAKLTAGLLAVTGMIAPAFAVSGTVDAEAVFVCATLPAPTPPFWRPSPTAPRLRCLVLPKAAGTRSPSRILRAMSPPIM